MNAGNIIAYLKLKTDDFKQGLREAKTSMQQTSADFAKIGGTMVAAGGAMAFGIKKCVDVAADFEAGMSRVGAVSGATGKDFDDLRATALKLGADTSFSSSQAAEGMQYLAMSGFNAKEIIAAMPGVLDMAAAGQVDLGTTANIAANSIRAFGLNASDTQRVADVLSKTFTTSNTTLTGLGDTMKYAAPAAKAVGWSLESVAAAAGYLGNVGIDASMAGTTLRSAIVNLSAPSKEAKKVLEEFGIKLVDSKGKMLPLADILNNMKDKFGNLTDAQKAAKVQTLFGTEAMSGMLALMSDPKGLDSYTKQLEQAGGTADRVATTQLDNLNGSIEALGGSFETAQIAIGNAFIPILRGLAEGLTNVLNWFNGLNPAVQTFIAYFLGITAASLIVLGSLLLFVGFLPTLLGWFSSLIGVVQSVGGAFIWLFTSPIGLIILGIAALVAAVIYLWNTNEGFRQKVIEIWNAILAFIQPAIQAIVSFISTQWAGLVSWWNAIMPQFLQACQNAWNMIWAVLSPIINLIVALIRFAFPLILAIIMQVWENIKGVISGALGVIKNLIEIFTYAFTGQWGKLWESVKSLVANAFQVLWNLFQLWTMGKLLKIVIALGSAIISAVGSFIGSVLGSVGSFVANIVGRFSGLLGSVTSIFGGIRSFISGVFSGLIGTVLGSLSGLISGIRDKVMQAKELLTELNPFKRHSPSLVDNVLAGVKVIKDTYQGISDMSIEAPSVGAYKPGRVDVAAMVGGTNGTQGTSGGSNGSTYNAPLVQVANMTVRNDDDIRQVSSELYNLQRNADRSQGR